MKNNIALLLLLMPSATHTNIIDFVVNTLSRPARTVASFWQHDVYEQGLKKGWNSTAAFFQNVVYDDIIKPAGQGFVDTAINAGNKIASGAQWVGERFKDTKCTRAADYAIRKAALETALNTAKAGLKIAEGTAIAPLYAAKATSEGILRASEEFLDKVVQQVTGGALVGAAEASKGVIIGVEKGTVWTLEGVEKVLTSPLALIDINEISYKGSLGKLQRGVLGGVRVEMIIAGQSLTPSITLDAKGGIDQLNSALKPIVNDAVEALEDTVHDMISGINNVLMTKKSTAVEMLEQSSQLQKEIGQLTQQAQQLENISAQTTAQVGEQYAKSKAEMVTTLKSGQENADKTLREEVKKTDAGLQTK